MTINTPVGVVETPREGLAWWYKPATVHRLYVEGRFGQVHLRIARPPGNPTARPVILLHQSPSTGRAWEDVVAELGKDRIAIAPDTPGFGDSDPPPFPPTIGDYAAALGDLLDRLNLPKVDIAGDHTGTKIAMEFARQRPHQAHRLFLNAAMVFTAAEQAMQKDTIEREKPHTPPADGSHLVEHFVRLRKYYAPDASLDHITRDFVEGLRGGPLMWYGHNASFNYDPAAALKDVPHAILQFIPNDGFTDFARRTVDHIRNGEVVEMPAWRLGSISQHPVALAALMRAFFDSRDVKDPDHLGPGIKAPAAPPPVQRDIHRRFVETSHGLLHLREAAPANPTRRALVCLHSSPLSSRYMENLIRRMATDRRVIGFDNPGYGESDRPTSPPRIEDYAAWIAEGIDACGLQDFDIVGDHTGAKIAVELALRLPQRVHAIALNASAIYTPEEQAKYKSLVGPVPATDEGTHLADLWRRAQSFKAPEAPEEVTQELVVEIMRAGPGWWWSSHASLNYDMEQKLQRLTQPVLLLFPAGDPLTALARRAVPVLPKATVREFPEFGSGVMQQHAGAIAQELRGFFDR